MKSSKFLFLIALFAMSLMGFSQKTFVGTINYTVEVEGADDMDAQMKSMLPTDMAIVTDGMKLRVEQISPMYTMIQLFDSKKGNAWMMFDIMGQKLAGESTKEDIAEAKAKMGLDTVKDPEIIYVDETKTIAGYKCKKAEIVEKEGESSIYFYTEDIIMLPDIKENTQVFNVKGLKGFPLEFTMVSQGMTMKMTAKEVIAKKPKSNLFFVDDDYNKVTMKEMLQMLGMGTE